MKRPGAFDPFNLVIAMVLVISACLPGAAASGGPKSAQEFAAQYMDAFNKKNRAALDKLRYKSTGKSEMQELMDQMMQAEMDAGTQYNKFEILPVGAKRLEPQMGPDGVFYEPSLTPTNLLKVTAETKDGRSSTTFPIGAKDGIFYQITVVPAKGVAPVYKFGWQRFTVPKGTWSFMMPNEPEPGRAAFEKELGKDALLDPDIYGVVKNTASIKTTQHFFQCGSEGKRIHADDNKEKYRAACTTYDPQTLKEWFSDPKKTLEDTVDLRTRSVPGKLISKKEIDMSGSPGREFEIMGEDGTYYLGRVYWIKDALYELTFESSKGKGDVASASKFLDSLQVK